MVKVEGRIGADYMWYAVESDLIDALRMKPSLTLLRATVDRPEIKLTALRKEATQLGSG